MNDNRITACQFANLQIPVELTPHAVIEEIRTECCGRPVISCIENPQCRTCEITIEQKICFRIPIRYSAEAKVGCVEISCCGECTTK